ncbi:MAG TPA: FkbM family methyltransferase [Pseudolabrys sp.]|nr:FkbM family methyltransferase [Pseudolabrys sp.]
MSAFRLKLRDGLIIETPPSLSAITTYVLLEQEEWFEKEIGFLRHFLKPGMTAIDIGANLGVYSLRMARLVAPGGRVFAYEPGGEARALLENSRNANGLGNLEVIGLALSDGAREGHLGFAASTELRALGSAGTGEPVHITSLDLEGAVHPWSSVDFVKIDAEGEEERILSGGKDFFSTHSPLVMFEIKAGDKVNERLRAIFPAVGYKLFRQLAGAPILVPVDAVQSLDGYELNLFAAKSDRAHAMAQQRLLVDKLVDWVPDMRQQQYAVSFWQRQKFSSLVKLSDGNRLSADGDYQNALIGYATWRASDQPAEIRCAALAFALQSVRAVCARAWTAERASTWARIAWEWGARSESITVLQRLLQFAGSAQLKEPFWPASARFDDVVAGGQPLDWFVAAAAEQYERTFSFSSVFSGASPLLSWLCGQRFVSAEMERRRVLTAARAGANPSVPERLCQPAPDHINADIWRAGTIPGTVL